MHITLINPPFVVNSSAADSISLSHCLGIRYISAYLKVKGNNEVTIIDAFKKGYETIKKYSNGFIVGLEFDNIINLIPPNTDIIGISVPFSHLAPIAHDLIDIIRRTFPEKMIIMGGIYPSTQPRQALESKADFIIVGEGEEAFLKISKGIFPCQIKGIYSKESLDLQRFQPTDSIEDLDSIPFPDYDIPDMDDYFYISSRGERQVKTAVIITSRGCPYNCEFCSIHPVYGYNWRKRSSKNVLEEIEFLVKKFEIKKLEFEDDNFTLNKQRTIEILEGIVKLNKEGYDLSWNAPNGLRIDTLDNEIIELMKKSNCKALYLALEHGDKEMLQIMNKRLDLDKAYQVIKMVVDAKIDIGLFYLVGYPGETKECFISGLNYLKKLKRLGGRIAIGYNTVKPYPGTSLLERCRKEGYITDPNIDNFLIKRDIISETVVIETPEFDKNEVLQRLDLIQRAFPPKHFIVTQILKKMGLLSLTKNIYHKMKKLN